MEADGVGMVCEVLHDHHLCGKVQRDFDSKLSSCCLQAAAKVRATSKKQDPPRLKAQMHP